MTVRRKHIRDLTLEILQKHEVKSAPVDVLKVAQGMGLEVRKHEAEDDISGFLFRDSKHAVGVIGINSRQGLARQRFTVAHEIGHHLLHSHARIHVDRGYEIKHRDNKSKEGTDVDEKEANLFAAELLMPEHFLARDLAKFGSIDLADEEALKDLAKMYKVSPLALAFRLAYLGSS